MRQAVNLTGEEVWDILENLKRLHYLNIGKGIILISSAIVNLRVILEDTLILLTVCNQLLTFLPGGLKGVGMEALLGHLPANIKISIYPWDMVPKLAYHLPWNLMISLNAVHQHLTLEIGFLIIGIHAILYHCILHCLLFFC